jgi:GT2 family glycosyltransferase
MCIAFGKALEKGFDYYLWINDDTKIFPNALQILIETSCQIGSDGIVVGSTFDPITRVHTYGGVQRTNPWHPLKFSPVYPEDTPKQAETMNGNCVLIPARIAHSVGNLDSSFTHGIGDFDYGFRSSKLGFRVIVSSGYIGHCTRNTLKNTWQDPDLPLIERIKKVRSPLGLPPKEYAIFAYRYGGIFWFFYWILPYIRMIIPVLSRWYTKGKNE